MRQTPLDGASNLLFLELAWKKFFNPLQLLDDLVTAKQTKQVF